MQSLRRFMGQLIKEGSGPAVCKVGRVLKHFRTSAVASDKFSRYPVPEFSALPEDLQATTRAYKEHAQIDFMPNVFSALAYRPDQLRVFLQYHEIVMAERGSLTLTEKEMIIVATSAENNCLYCVVAHGAILRLSAKSPTISDQLVANWRTADLTARQRAILEFAVDLCHCKAVTDEQIASLEKHGLSKDDALDIGSVVAFFALSNRLAITMDWRPNKEYYGMGRSIQQDEE